MTQSTCPSCKRSLEKDLKFCPYCGTEISLHDQQKGIDSPTDVKPTIKASPEPKLTPCLLCGKEIPVTDDYCSFCGAEKYKSKREGLNRQQAFQCPKCKNLNPAGTKFCLQCGQPIAVAGAEKLLETWDLICGHHPHVVQPITKVKKANINKLLAYSAGNFAAGLEVNAHKYGLIMKCEIGPLQSDSSKLAVGKVEWKFTYNDNDIDENIEKYVKFKKNMPKPEEGPIMLVKIVEENEFFPQINFID